MSRRIAIFAVLAAAFGCRPSASPVVAPVKVRHIRVVIAFTASWCGPCQRNKPAIAELERQGITVIHVDVDAEKAKTKEFRVSSYPTYVVQEDGTETERTHSVDRLRELLPWLKGEE